MIRKRPHVVALTVIGVTHLVASVAALVAFEATIDVAPSRLVQKTIVAIYTALTGPIRLADRMGVHVGDHWFVAFLINTAIFVALVAALWGTVGRRGTKDVANQASDATSEPALGADSSSHQG